MKKPIVIIESPYAGDVEANVEYAQKAMHDSLLRGEAPYASHLLYTQPNVLDDEVPEERKMGMEAGFEYRRVAEKSVVYWDRGISGGMKAGIADARKKGRPVEFRSLEGKQRCYLAGPMEYTEDNGIGWRLEFAAALKHLGVECVIPEHEEEHILKGRDWVTLKRNNLFEYKEMMREIIDQDLYFVETVDFIVVHWNGERMSGTVHEVGKAYEIGKPVYLVTPKEFSEVPGWFLGCFTEQFHTLEALTHYLTHHNM